MKLQLKESSSSSWEPQVYFRGLHLTVTLIPLIRKYFRCLLLNNFSISLPRTCIPSASHEYSMRNFSECRQSMLIEEVARISARVVLININ